MGAEVERKFVIADPPADLDRWSSSHIVQRYLVVGADGFEVRLRRRDGRMTITVKHGVGLVRSEDEFEVDLASFERLWPMCDGISVEKRRYHVPERGHTVEVDIYEGPLAGLVTAEVEFASADDARSFEPQAWMGNEVTGDPRYTNQRLALKGRPRS